MEDEILTVAYRLFVRDGYDGTTVEGIAAESGVPVHELHRYFTSKDAILAAIGFRAVERALEDLPPDPSMGELTRRLADGFVASFAHDGAELAFRSVKDHHSVHDALPVWRQEWATQLGHGLAAAADRERPNLRDRIVSGTAMEVIGVGLDEWLHHPSDGSLGDVVAEIVGRLGSALGGST